MATPFIVYGMMHDGTSLLLAVSLFTFAALTDFYDGYYARKFEVVSKTGIFLDPLADKILILSLFATICAKGLMNWWMLAVIIGREVMITVLRVLMIRKGFTLKTSSGGKIKTVVQFFALYVCFFHLISLSGINHPFFELFASAYLPHGALIAALLATVYSGVEYLYYNRMVLLKVCRVQS